MDKYEYNLKLDQMKSLYAEEKYEDAADIADTINWNKIKNVNALVKAGEIYEKTERYEDSRDVLLMAYDRSPIGRMIIYRLAEVAIKMKDFESAQDYYDEFVEIAPHDSLKYVLRYNLKKAQGAPYSELIPILEELKDQEYTEEWAYELAYLYHKAGMSDKCIDACDELILWFGDGPYVERALELKMLYQPLTKTQEEKYRSFRQARDSKDGMTHINVEEMQRAGEYAHDPVAIPQVSINPEKFNTVNLQEEIAKGMQQIIDATEKETVTDTLDNINKMVEEIPYLKIPQGESNPVETDAHIETDEEIDGSLKINFKEMLGEDSDGQMSMMTDDRMQVERQITGQITIEEVLEEWEKTKRAAEAALEEANQRKLESAKARALQQAGNIMDRLTGVIPKLDAGVTPRELLEEEYLQDKPDSVNPEATHVAEEAADEAMQEELQAEEFLAEETPEEIPVSETEIPVEEQPYAEDVEDFSDEYVPENPETEEAETVDQEESLEDIMEEDTDGLKDVPMIDIPQKQTAQKSPVKEKPQAEHNSWKGRTVRMPEITEPVNLVKEEHAQAEEMVELTDAEKTIFSYFMPVKGMERQLRQALTGATHHLKHDATASTGNLMIQGGHGCGKTTLATSVVKVLQQETGKLDGKIGKIQAEALNQKDIGQMLRKVAGGCLIIENVGELTRQSAITLSLLLEQDRSGIYIIIEDTSKGIKKALSLDDGFARKFTEQISVPIFTNDELVTFARSYSRELGYKIDDMAVLALYNRISNIQRLDQATTLTEVKEIVDEAIDREAHGGIKKAISILTASRYTDDDRIVLREKDFE